MTIHTHVDVPTQFIEAGGIRFAYRRFGATTGVPLIFLQHFRGGMDHWDPLLTNGLGRDRPVILFDNAGVAASGGKTPQTFEAMAEHVATFVAAMGLQTIDLLGFSIGGFVAQALTLAHPKLVRRLILAGTGPRGGVPGSDARVGPAATHDVPTIDDFLLLFFSPSAESQAAGRAFWDRRQQRTEDVDPPSSQEAMLAQLSALTDWGQARGVLFADLRQIGQPTLVVNGSNDIMVPTINSWHLAQAIPNAQLIIYPDAGHGSQYQYPERFLAHARSFLDSAEPAGVAPAAGAVTAALSASQPAEAVGSWPPAH
ncbi:alpha/beta fold hydrolase [Variovorax sp. dw_308]|uniref:alpha/beta fold hydrolase n=1 Tax=Variovorax sp. dw_308 TaxID=2721546 RepID=UPI001C4672AC|nr:alpha/beta hydrolase [Variovorax sp. dw_308]